MLEPDAPEFKKYSHSLKREDSIEQTYQYQRDREATLAVRLVRVEKNPTPNIDHTTLHTLITTYTQGAANFLLVHP